MHHHLLLVAAIAALSNTSAHAQCSTSHSPVNEIVIRSGAGPCDGEQLRRSLGKALSDAQVIAVAPSGAAASGALADVRRTPAQAALWRISQAPGAGSAAPAIITPGMAGAR